MKNLSRSNTPGKKTLFITKMHSRNLWKTVSLLSTMILLLQMKIRFLNRPQLFIRNILPFHSKTWRYGQTKNLCVLTTIQIPKHSWFSLILLCAKPSTPTSNNSGTGLVVTREESGKSGFFLIAPGLFPWNYLS